MCCPHILRWFIILGGQTFTCYKLNRKERKASLLGRCTFDTVSKESGMKSSPPPEGILRCKEYAVIVQSAPESIICQIRQLRLVPTESRANSAEIILGKQIVDLRRERHFILGEIEPQLLLKTGHYMTEFC